MKNIGIFTSSRADFGILRNIIKKLDKSKFFKLFLYVSGSHLSKKFGYTIKEIKSNNFENIILLNNLVFRKGDVDIFNSSKKLDDKLDKALSKLNIQIMIVLGDRYELLSVAKICFLKGIELVHIHGGEKTLGALDNSIRNSVSILSKYHFVATNKSKLNLIKFGINKRNIFCIGAPGLEGIKKEIKSYKYLENKYKFKFWKKYFSFYSSRNIIQKFFK